MTTKHNDFTDPLQLHLANAHRLRSQAVRDTFRAMLRWFDGPVTDHSSATNGKPKGSNTPVEA